MGGPGQVSERSTGDPQQVQGGGGGGGGERVRNLSILWLPANSDKCFAGFSVKIGVDSGFGCVWAPGGEAVEQLRLD